MSMKKVFVFDTASQNVILIKFYGLISQHLDVFEHQAFGIWIYYMN